MLGLICGHGLLPAALASAVPERPFVAALEGFAPTGLAADIVFRIETLGTLFEQLRRAGVTQICLCGAIRRPDIDPARIDVATAPLVPAIQSAIAAGDDSALRTVMRLLEDAGFAVVAAHDLAPHLLVAEGCPTVARPRPEHTRDAAIARQTIARMGARDIGQACVVAGGSAIAREDAAGTDAMLARLARDRSGGGGLMDGVGDLIGGTLDDMAGWLSGGALPTSGGILYKGPKPQQDLRADLPTIGPDTVDAVAAAKLEGIVVDADRVIALDMDEIIRRCDAYGLFLWGRV